jgi:hypothetical protein
MNLPMNRGLAACSIMASAACLSFTPLTFGQLAGDSTLDNRVDVADVLDVTSNMYLVCPAEPESCSTDFNQNDLTDAGDLLIVFENWGAVGVSEDMSGEQSDSGNGDPAGNEPNLVGPAPVLMDSIYYDHYSRLNGRAQLAYDLDQGTRTRQFNIEKGNSVLPYCYGGGADYNADMEYTDQDLDEFEAWLDANIPYDYDGPVVLDMEGGWWSMMEHAEQGTMDEIIDFYIEGLEYAESMRPDAKFGYWGLPKKSMTQESYQGPGVDRLLQRSGAIFPDTYESNVGGNDAVRMEAHIQSCLEKTAGLVPVYVQMSPRYRDQELGGWRHFHTNEELLRDQAKPAMDARWTDADGQTHRIAGLALWDAYVYVKQYNEDWYDMNLDEIDMLWGDVDAIHHSIYEDLSVLVEAANTPVLEDEPVVIVQDVSVAVEVPEAPSEPVVTTVAQELPPAAPVVTTRKVSKKKSKSKAKKKKKKKSKSKAKKKKKKSKSKAKKSKKKSKKKKSKKKKSKKSKKKKSKASKRSTKRKRK